MAIELPCNPDLESLLIGAIINDPQAAEVILHEMKSEDFVSSKNLTMFHTLSDMYVQKLCFDTILIVKSLRDRGPRTLEDVGGLGGIMAYSVRAYSGLPYQDFINELRELTARRRLMFLCTDTLSSLEKPVASEKVISVLQDGISAVQGIEVSKTKVLSDVHPDFSKELEHRMMCYEKGISVYQGICSGYEQLDHVLGSFTKGCMYYIGARTSMGKTTFLLNLARNMSEKSTKIGFFSLEMPAKIIFEKFLAMEAEMRYPWIQDGRVFPDQLHRVEAAHKKITKLPIFIEDPSSLDIKSLCYRARRMKLQHGIEVLFIDYLTRITVENRKQSKHLQVDEISKTLQSLAKELDIPIICLAQLNRASTKKDRESNRPCLSDFRESGSIEEDADACILLHRPEYYKEGDKPGMVEVIVAKNRLRGIVKTIPFVCKSIFCERYREASELEIEEWRQESEQKKKNNSRWDSKED